MKDVLTGHCKMGYQFRSLWRAGAKPSIYHLEITVASRSMVVNPVKQPASSRVDWCVRG